MRFLPLVKLDATVTRDLNAFVARVEMMSFRSDASSVWGKIVMIGPRRGTQDEAELDLPEMKRKAEAMRKAWNGTS